MEEKTEELSAVIAEIRDRVRARNPNGMAAGYIPLPDMTPLVHARDSAEAKVASIGTVNPRPGGLKNSIVQSLKRTVARALDWHIREQVEFNRGVMECVQAVIENLNETKQGLSLLAGKLSRETEALRSEANELKDIRAHWVEWRAGWEQKLSNNEIHFLRSISDLQASFQHRVVLQTKAMQTEFEHSMVQQNEEMQRRYWEELSRVRLEYERIIHTELRVLRQKASFAQAAAHVVESTPPEFANVDWLKFADRFRGSEEDIHSRQQMYASRFRDQAPVLDLGCGRGEIIQILGDAGIKTRGVDSHPDSIAFCRAKGLEVEQADLFTYLRDLPDASLGGVICCQVIEHLPPPRLPEMIQLAHAKLRAGGLIALETPNPECLAIFATHFYIDPTHRHPIPPALTTFYLEEAGFGQIDVQRLSPAIESMPSVAELPEAFRNAFFGGLDYAAFGIKLG